MIGLQLVTAPEHMIETGLMQRLFELPIRRPAIAHEDAAVLGPQDRGGLVKAASGLNGIDGCRGGRIDPEPLQLPPPRASPFRQARQRDSAAPSRSTPHRSVSPAARRGGAPAQSRSG